MLASTLRILTPRSSFLSSSFRLMSTNTTSTTPSTTSPTTYKKPATLVLLRHGESVWNSQNLYTGWCDVPLTPSGELEARTAGRLLYDNGFHFDTCHTSLLRRASFTANMCLNTANQHWVQVHKTWRLNERHYGLLQGYNKDTAFKELDIDPLLLMRMRRTWDEPPPKMPDSHPYWHGEDRRYCGLGDDNLERSRGESLKMTAERVGEYYDLEIKPRLLSGSNVLIVSHANTLRSLIKEIDSIPEAAIKTMTIPTGIPMIYRLDPTTLTPIAPSELKERGTSPIGYTWGDRRGLGGFRGTYLGDVDRLKDIQAKRDVTNRDFQRIILRDIWDKCIADDVGSTRDILMAVYRSLEVEEYANMLLLHRMMALLEEEVRDGKESKIGKFITKEGYEAMIKKVRNLSVRNIACDALWSPFITS